MAAASLTRQGPVVGSHMLLVVQVELPESATLSRRVSYQSFCYFPPANFMDHVNHKPQCSGNKKFMIHVLTMFLLLM
jgi:hypothetical protein